MPFRQSLVRQETWTSNAFVRKGATGQMKHVCAQEGPIAESWAHESSGLAVYEPMWILALSSGPTVYELLWVLALSSVLGHPCF